MDFWCLINWNTRSALAHTTISLIDDERARSDDCFMRCSGWLSLWWMERFDIVLLEDFRLNDWATLFYEPFPLLSLHRERTHVLPCWHLQLLLLARVDQLECCVLVQVHFSCNDLPLWAKDGALTLRSDERPLILIIDWASHDYFVSLRWFDTHVSILILN